MLLVFPVALAGELDEFLSVSPAVPVTVHCGGDYTLYAYTKNGGIDAILVVQGGEPVFDFDSYRRVVAAYLYKEHVSKSADNVKLLNPSAVPTFAQLRSKLVDEAYDLSVARNYAQKCFPDFVSQIDTMDSLRGSIVSELNTFISELGSESQKLVDYMKSGDVRCDFKVNTGVYDELSRIVNDLTTLESYSKQLRANIAVADTNCTPDVVQAITSALKTPYTTDQLQFFVTSAATEKAIFSYAPSDDEIRALLRRTIQTYWKTLYEQEMQKPVHSSFGDMPLKDAASYILNSNVPWADEQGVKDVQSKMDEIANYVSNAEFDKAYSSAKDLYRIVGAVFKSGIRQEQSGGVPGWVYAVLAVIVGLILWKKLGGRGGDETDEDSDVYGYDYA